MRPTGPEVLPVPMGRDSRSGFWSFARFMIEGENGGRVHGEDQYNASEGSTYPKRYSRPTCAVLTPDEVRMRLANASPGDN